MMNTNSPNHHLNEEYYFIKNRNTFFSFRMIQTPSLSIFMIEGNLQSGKENAPNSQTATKEMASMNEAIAFIVQLVHQKTLEGYTLVDASKREQNKELSIKNDNISEMPLEISSNPSEGSLSPCNVPSKSPSSQTEYLVSEKDSKSEGKSVSDEFELIERKESEGRESKDFEQEKAPIVPNTLVEHSFKMIDFEQEDFDDIQALYCRSPKQDICTKEVSVSTFHRVNKEAIMKKAEELNIECDFRYHMMMISGLKQNINEFKNYLYQVEESTKEALYPKYWDLKDTNAYSEIEVAHDSEEFEEIASLMTEKVLRLVRIQNYYLMSHYITNLNMRQEVSEEKLNRKLLFHGTGQVEPSQIYKSFDTGFNIQDVKEENMFEKGLYFAQQASDSHAFAFPVNVEQDKYQLILADVFVGKPSKDLKLTNIKPPKGYDSILAPGNGYIICNNFQSYPLYLVEYTMQKPIRPVITPSLKIPESISAILSSATEVDKIMNDLAPPPLDDINELIEKNRQLITKYENMKKDLTTSRRSHLEKKSTPKPQPHSISLDRFNFSFNKIMGGNKLNRPPYNNQLSVSALNRIKKDIIEIQTDTSLDFLFVEQPDETNLSNCMLCLIGPPYSAYEGGIFRIEFTFPDDYPLNPPLVSFKTQIYHPCIDDSGNICLGLLNQWRPTGSVKQIGLLISALLDNPLLEEPLMLDISSQYETNKQSFVSQACLYTQKYAE